MKNSCLQTTLILGLLLIQFSTFAQKNINAKLIHDGVQREYIVYVPSSYSASKPTPVVFCFHGYGGNADWLASYTKFQPIADKEGFIVVYPKGLLDEKGNSHWNVGAWTVGSKVDDVGFTGAMLDKLIDTYTIDQTRVYSTGFSNGGYMSFKLACELSNRIAAIAPVSGSMSLQVYKACKPQHPTPVLEIHGTADGTIAYNGTGWTKSVNDALLYWTRYNKTATSPKTTMFPNKVTTDNSTVEHIIYEGGTDGVSVEHLKIIGGPHVWPGHTDQTNIGNKDIDGATEIWKFFSKYSLKGLSLSTDEVSFNGSNPKFSMYPNPTKSHLTINGDLSKSIDFKVFSLLGKKVLEGTISNNNRQINLTSLSPGAYFINIDQVSYSILKTE